MEDKFCTLLRDEFLHLERDWPAKTPISVTFSLNNEGILSVNAVVQNEIPLNFDLKIEGVKSVEELSKSMAAIEKATLE